MMTRFILGMMLSLTCSVTFAQDTKEHLPPEGMREAIMADDSAKLATFVTRTNVNDCYGNYSILSHAIRTGAMKCFYLLIADSADVNKICNGYLPPLMHAAKYGRLEMVKMLVSLGADVHFTYRGDYTAAQGETPITYAEMFQKTDVVNYLKTIK
jgi:hypothetical protein